MIGKLFSLFGILLSLNSFASEIENNFENVVRIEFLGQECTGALIAPKVVLTAAHCLRISEQVYFTSVYSYSTKQHYEAEKLILHPEAVFKNGSLDEGYDIGLIILKEAIDLDKNRYIKLAKKFSYKIGSKVKFVGIKNENGQTSKEKVTDKEIEISEIPFLKCGGNSFPKTYVTTLTGQPGDSGAPTFIKDVKTGQYLQVGILSAYINLKETYIENDIEYETGCKAVLLHVKVDSFIRWIEKETGYKSSEFTSE